MDPDEKGAASARGETSSVTRARGGRAAKRDAILRGALRVFAAEGYFRSSIDAIAAEAQVSTRTIYNHFLDKADLFRTLISDSATTVAAAEISLIDAYLHDGADPEAELTSFARAWLTSEPAHADHRALVRQITAEPGPIPGEAIAAWREAGPLRVQLALAEKFSAWSDAGVLRQVDAVQSAVHFGQLIAAARPGPASGAATRDETDRWIVAGVRAFLHGYARERARELDEV